MKENYKLSNYALSDVTHLKIHGRTTKNLSPLTLFWTGSAIELNIKGSELWIEVEVTYDTYESWISVLINSAMTSRQMLTSGRYWVCIFRGMNENTVKNVRIVKDVQAMNEDPGSCLQIHNVKFDGESLPIEDKPYKIEFIGDSITSGEGLIGAKQEEDWIPMWFSAVNNYAKMTADALNADYRIVSESGWGVLTGWDNNPNNSIPKYYEKICGILTGEKNKSLGALEENDFISWQPDVIVVNLATNDASAFDTPEWENPVTGEVYKQRRNPDGSYNKEDIKCFEENVENFLSKLRKFNQKAQIIWVYGMLGMPLMPSIYHAVAKYISLTRDNKVSVFQLPNTTAETVGSRCHPGILSHEKAAMELSAYIKDNYLNEA